MSFPDNITCPISNCNYIIISQKQNEDVFLRYCQETIDLLNSGNNINYSLRFQSFLYGRNLQSIKILEIAECFDNTFFKKSNNLNSSSIKLKKGMIIISPFDKIIVEKLSELLIHKNIKIVTYDFTTDLTYLIDEEIKFDFDQVIDGSVSQFTGQKIFELPFTNLIAACNRTKLIRPTKHSKSQPKSKQNYHNSSEFLYLLQNTDESINNLLNDEFWESIVCDCAYVAIAFAGAFNKLGKSKIVQSTEEKIKAFKQIQQQFGTFGPLFMKKFYNYYDLLHSNDISNQNQAYDLWVAASSVIIKFDAYSKIISEDKRVSKRDIIILQKKAENKIFGNDIDDGIKDLIQSLDEAEKKRKNITENNNNNNANNDLNQNNNNNNSNQNNNYRNSNQNKNNRFYYQNNNNFNSNQNNNNNNNSYQNNNNFSSNQNMNSRNDKKLIRKENNRIDAINIYVKQNSPYLKELDQIWTELYPKFVNIEQILNDAQLLKLVDQAVENINKYNKLFKKHLTVEKKKLMNFNVKEVLIAINILLNFLSNKQIKNESKIIGKKLFKVIFNPTNDKTYITKVFSVYQMHDNFINAQESIANFKSSTGSGKTRCAPFFFAIKAIEDDMKRPFFIMTQPGFSIIKDKMTDFQNILGNSVTLVKDIWEMVDLYVNFMRFKNGKREVKQRLKNLFIKPIIGLFSPISLLSLIQKLQKRNINICSFTRFCLDEIHERSVESDVLEAILSSKMNYMAQKGKNFPFQLLMMSATPDSRILNCFQSVTRYELPNSQLFNVETIKKEVENKNQVHDEVIKQTFDIIKRMADKKVQPGHILIFSSGNQRINDIQTEIYENAETNCSSRNCVIVVIRNFDLMFKDLDIIQFYKNLDEFITQETNRINSDGSRFILFLLPIKYAGYVSNEQKEIGKNPIPKHSNVIKIIMATNAIESSITIDGLAAVVDSGLFNHSSYNKNNGLTSLNEEPISIQSQTQRKGRVGRLRPGISVQITMKNNALQNLLPPAIKTSDISLNILSLRKIGYRLEDIRNLPDKLDKSEIDGYISELVKFNALTRDKHNLTPYGRDLGSFSFVSPFVASAIIKVAGYRKNEIISNCDTNNANEIKKEFRLLLGVLISLIFGASDLCVNRFSKKLRYYFDVRSDIITLLRTLLDLAQMRTFEIKNKAFDYGFNSQVAIKILGQVQQTAENLFLSSKNVHQTKQDEEPISNDGDDIIKDISNIDEIQTPVNNEPEIQPKTTNTIHIEKRKATTQLIITKKSSAENIETNEQKNKSQDKNEEELEELTLSENDQDEYENDNDNEQQNNNKSQNENEEQTMELIHNDNEEQNEQDELENGNEQPNNKSQNDQDSKESHEENKSNQPNNTNVSDVKKQYFNRKSLFKNLKELVDQLHSQDLLFQFIQQLINEIGKNKPEWISCRRVQFANIEYAYYEPSLIYSGDKSLSPNDSSSFVYMRMRPGSVGLDSPGAAFILCISHESTYKMNYGSLIHCDLEAESRNMIPHPISIETSFELFNDFSEPLIEACLGDDQSHFKKFCRERWNRIDDGNCLFFKSQSISSEYNSKSKGKPPQPKYYFSFIPKDAKALELFNTASKTIMPLLPYTPSTILIRHPNLKCTIAIHGVGTDKIDSSVHFLTDKDYFAYQMNPRIIKLLLKNIDLLSSVDEILSIGITGESFCYPLGDSDFKKQNHLKTWYPHCNPKCTSVFSNEPFFYSHLVMLTKTKLPKFASFELPWVTEQSSLELVEDDLILYAANEMAREQITVRKAFNRLLFTNSNSYLKTDGSIPYVPYHSHVHYNLFGGSSYLLNHSSDNDGRINQILNDCAKVYIQGDSLTKPVELKSFYYLKHNRNTDLIDIDNIPNATIRKVFGKGCYSIDVVDSNLIEEVKKQFFVKLKRIIEINNYSFYNILSDNDLKEKVFNLINSDISLKNSILYDINNTRSKVDFIKLICLNPALEREFFTLKYQNEEFKKSIQSSISLKIQDFDLFSITICGDVDIQKKIYKLLTKDDKFIKLYFDMIDDDIAQTILNIIDENPDCKDTLNDYTYQYYGVRNKIFASNDSYINPFEIISNYKQLEKTVFNVILGYPKIRHNLFESITTNEQIQKYAFNEYSNNPEIHNLIFNQDNDIVKLAMLECHLKNKDFKIKLYDSIKNNYEQKNLFFEIISEHEFIVNKINSKIIQNQEICNRIVELSNKMAFKNKSDLEFDIETIQLYYVTIKHSVHSSLTKEEFIDKVESVVKKFGAIIAKTHEYSDQKRTITILMYSSYFTLPLVGMIKEALHTDDPSKTLRIPNNVIDNILLNDNNVVAVLNEWFKENKINIKQNDLQFIGSEEDVKIALDKFKSNPPQIPFVAYPIQGHINLYQINNHVNHINRNKNIKWYLNRTTRTLLIPTSEDEKEIAQFFSQFSTNYITNQKSNKDQDESKIDDILYDSIEFHGEEAILSRYLINIYLQNGKLIQRNFCVECVYDTFKYNLRKMYNESEERCNYQEITNDDQMIPIMTFVECEQIRSTKIENLVQLFPIIPFGQLLWAFINEPKIANLSRTWITALAFRTLKKTPKITFCPLHPYILFPSPPIGESMRCMIPTCDFYFCNWCHTWHKKGKKCEKNPKIPPGDRVCPFCHEIIEKMKMCNHIHCRCGKDFCYYCGAGFASSADCYKHMDEEKHNDEAPDYRKFIRNEVVSSEALNDFYKKYPKWIPVFE